ncbi:TIGR03564 family F420-dependent LLM class oxidoreductase [Candidatus Marimicrobium litorale]|uniref:TIGR03564 family F420-dependent LLM class oxidoreductase n=1 Tax=Candidatus Marimicrobium litorale TaxID=2518991 RepID=A0ABT3T542_9GAMM|nr:TIGR03564 family F420-dependent LLM class oxidoreductase [Candidatus Marimicrobium litorale]MCX2976921.1 TIGR03564 family F420-dependent LLM class oxidoreductase [Candidatus Marimicrobium litorale]
MKFGIMTGSGFDPAPGLSAMMENAQRIEKLGFHSLWMATIYNYDALTALAAIGTATREMELGTAVVATHPRHPMAMAQQALTAAAACNNRFTLGIGLSHRYVIEQEMGLSYDRPAHHMREYLNVLLPLLQTGTVDYEGELYQTNASLDIPEANTPPVVIAALGPAMLKLAGNRTAGTTLWLTGVKTIAEHTVPTIIQAAADAGRKPPRVIAGVPVVLASDPDSARAMVDRQLGPYKNIPSYRAMLDREGASGPGDVALVGNESELRQQLQTLRKIGVTDLNAVLVNESRDTYENTLAFLADEIKAFTGD